MILRADFERLTKNEFIDIITGKYGWAVGAQAKSIIKDEEDLEDQNPNALAYMAEQANESKEYEIEKEIRTYLNSIGYEE